MSRNFRSIFLTNLSSGNLLAEIDVDPDEDAADAEDDSAHFSIRYDIPVGKEDKDLLCFVWYYKKKKLFKLCSGRFIAVTFQLPKLITNVLMHQLHMLDEID